MELAPAQGRLNKADNSQLLFSGIIIALVTAFLGFFYFYPIAEVLIRSVTQPVPGLGNYAELMTSALLLGIMFNTIYVSFLTTVICILIAYPFVFHAVMLRSRLTGILIFLSIIPLLTAVLARLYSWTIILGRHGLINNLLISLNVIDRPIEIMFSRTAVIIGMVHVLLPYMIIVLYSTMRGIDTRLLDASRSLGAGAFETFWRVFLPLSLPGVYAGSIIVFVISLGFFITPAVLGGSRNLMISVFIEQEVNLFRWGVASAMSVVLVVATCVLYFFFDKLFGVDRLLTGGSRG